MTDPSGTIRIGAGAGFSGDRIEPALDLVRRGGLDYICFECLAERTIALAHLAMLEDPDSGFDPRLDARMERVLPACREAGTRIVTNMGAANPRAAARRVAEIARRSGLKGVRIAALTGDDVLGPLKSGSVPFGLFDGEALPADPISASAYLGAEGIVEALDQGADVVITGRTGDPALFLAPMIHEFGWAADDWETLGRGTAIGHLLECAGQLTGGYFADPGAKEVAGLARLGFPMADVAADGSAILSKLPETGGLLDLATCKEQLLYELIDPSAYLQPDVTADFSGVRFETRGENRIAILGASGRQRPDALKVSIGYLDGFIGEGQITYAGPGALGRARLALDIVRERLAMLGLPLAEVRFEIIGLGAVDPRPSAPGFEPREPRIRVAARAEAREAAEAVGQEVEALYTNGPAGGGGVSRSVRRVVAVGSALLAREHAAHALNWEMS